VRRSIHCRGLWKTGTLALAKALHVPRRVQHFLAELFFDVRHGVRTRGKQWHGQREGAFAHAYFYSGSPQSKLRELLGALDVRDRVLIDLGCGSGKVLLVASRFPFKALVGVELSSELAELAKANTAGNPRIEIVVGDATTYAFSDDPLVVYLYNPFDGEVLAAVLDNLRRSLETSPRPTTIVYYHPVHRDVADEASFLRLENEGRKYVVYAAGPSG
jgi:SAM-dependent methyltransferase